MRLELADVTAGYGDTVAVRDIDLVVPSGTVVALLGPNGAGKTTLLRLLSGLITPHSGRILLDQRDVTGITAPALARAGVCHVTEGRSIFASLTVRENLALFARGGESSEVAEMAVSAFPKLGQRMGQVAGTLSGGEQQMLALARAYVSGAPMVLLDEVSMGLAPIIVDEIFGFLQLLREQGTSLLVVEQYVAKALAIADHVYVLSRGRIAFRGEAQEMTGDELAERYLGATV